MEIKVIHQDLNLASSYFKNEPKLFVTSIFRTIQSEGPFTGSPAIFIRMAGCNFGAKSPDTCRWCDTSFEIAKAKQYTVEELITEVNGIRHTGDIIVLTGGEPTLQHRLLDFMVEVCGDCIVQIETNGTQASFFKALGDKKYYELRKRLCVVASPKAGIKGYAPLSPTVLSNVVALKFVVSSNGESNQHEVPAWAFDVLKLKIDVYVSPMAVYKKSYEGEVSSIWDLELIDADATSKNYAYAAKYALDNDFKLSLQGHLFCAIP